MSIVVDANVLLRAAQLNHAQHAQAQAAVTALSNGGHGLCVVPQVLFEFWVVATRPLGENGLGLTIGAARAHMDEIRLGFTLLEDPPGITDRWQELVLAHEVRGKKAHDARLVASIKMHGMSDILTFNAADFSRYDGLRAIHPAQVFG